MLPACVANIYKNEQVQIDLVSLSEYCKIKFIKARVIGIDRTSNILLTDAQDENAKIPYNVLSINIGSRTLGIHFLRLLYKQLINNLGLSYLGTYSIPGVLEHTVTTRPISDLIRKCMYL